MNYGEFYTVATPIGTLKDTSARALEILSAVDYIACEDKRVSSVFLSNFKINKPLLVYQKHNEQEAAQKIISLIKEGKSVALISDAGVPCISDPGKILVKNLFEQGIKTTAISGACAITTILSSAPREDETFAFAGFLPRTKPAQEKIFNQFKNIDFVFYESPKRLIETLKNIAQIRGETQKIAIGRELTKKFEEIICDTTAEVLKYFSNNTLKGEITGLLYKTEQTTLNNYDNEIKRLLKEGFSAKDTATIISTVFDTNKKEIYSKAVKLKKITN